MQRGKRIRPGDTIGFIAPSGAVRTEGTVERAAAEAEKAGFRVKLGESCSARYGYLAGSDALRAEDVNRMFMDDEVDAIMCVRGGYGVTRMLDLLDFDAIAAHPKVFIGLSDITALHIALLQRANLATFHGPMAAADWDKPMHPFSYDGMMRAIGTAEPMGELVNEPGYPARMCVNPGCAEGVLVGGNLSLIASLLGTPYELDTTGRILFIEEIGEKTYCIDRMLTQLRLAGKFDDCAGVVFGNFKDCPVEYAQFGLTLEQVVRDVVAPSGKPVWMGLQSGHCTPKLTLPLGVRCRMDAQACTLTVMEAAVRE